MFSLVAFLSVCTFFLFHKLDIWPLPVPIVTLVSEITTLLFFVELAFYIYFRQHTKGLQWFTTPPPHSEAHDPALRRQLLEKMLNSLSVETWGDCKETESFLRGWFLYTVDDAREIPRGNIEQWISWALFYKFPSQLVHEERLELSSFVDYFESRTGYKFKPGFNPKIKSMRLSLDPLYALHRPLMVYCAIALFNSISKLVLSRVLGFTRKRLGGFHYWYKLRDENDTRRRKLPLVFIHGLGQGLMNYLHFVSHIKDRDVFLVELSHISTRVWEHVPQSTEVVDFIHNLLQEHNYRRAVFMGHSFGTITIAWCIRYRPNMVHAAMLIDPVTLLTCYPLTCYTFVYEPPNDIFKWIRYLTVAGEMGISRVMKRNFWWQENILWVQDLPYHVPLPDSDDRCAFYPTTTTSVAASTVTHASGVRSTSTSTLRKDYAFVPLRNEVDIYGVFHSPHYPNPRTDPSTNLHSGNDKAEIGSYLNLKENVVERQYETPARCDLDKLSKPDAFVQKKMSTPPHTAAERIESVLKTLSPRNPYSPLSVLVPFIDASGEALDQLRARVREVQSHEFERLESLADEIKEYFLNKARDVSIQELPTKPAGSANPTEDKGSGMASVQSESASRSTRSRRTAASKRESSYQGPMTRSRSRSGSQQPSLQVLTLSTVSNSTQSLPASAITPGASPTAPNGSVDEPSAHIDESPTASGLSSPTPFLTEQDLELVGRRNREDPRRIAAAAAARAAAAKLTAAAELSGESQDGERAAAAAYALIASVLESSVASADAHVEDGVSLASTDSPRLTARNEMSESPKKQQGNLMRRQMKLGLFLGAKDDLLPAEKIVRHLRLFYAHQHEQEMAKTGSNRQPTWRDIRTRVLFEHDHIHGTFLFNGATRETILALLPWLEED